MNKWDKSKHFSEHLMTKRRQKIDDMAKVRVVRERLDPERAKKERYLRKMATLGLWYGAKPETIEKYIKGCW